MALHIRHWLASQTVCVLYFQLSRQEFADLVKIVGHEDAGQRLSWLFTALPTILLAILFILWCVAFILVILLFPDDAPSKYSCLYTYASWMQFLPSGPMVVLPMKCFGCPDTRRVNSTHDHFPWIRPGSRKPIGNQCIFCFNLDMDHSKIQWAPFLLCKTQASDARLFPSEERLK